MFLWGPFYAIWDLTTVKSEGEWGSHMILSAPFYIFLSAHQHILLPYVIMAGAVTQFMINDVAFSRLGRFPIDVLHLSATLKGCFWRDS